LFKIQKGNQKIKGLCVKFLEKSKKIKILEWQPFSTPLPPDYKEKNTVYLTIV